MNVSRCSCRREGERGEKLRRTGELERVAAEVADDLAQAHAVTEEQAWVRHGVLLDEVEALLLGEDAKEARVGDDVRERERFLLELELARLELAEVEDGADEVEQHLGAAHGLLDERALVVGEPVRVAEEEPARGTVRGVSSSSSSPGKRRGKDALADSENGSDGRADLVADGRKELGLEAVGLASGELRASRLGGLRAAVLERVLGLDALADVDADGDAAGDGLGVRVRDRDRGVADEGDDL